MTEERREPEPVKAFATAKAFERWLEANHERSDGIWLKLAKPAAPAPTVTYAEAVEVALCFGWIDGRKDRFDERYWLQRSTPRRARSRWSRINRDRAAQLVLAGRMRAAGQREIERAQADGRWAAAYAGQATAAVPEDLQRELDADPALARAFAALDGRNRYAILYRLNDAKRPETRARRLAAYVDMLRAGERLHD
jgi:uncharacterized protein YdeI (YjbR/CyaY-like superfamily)